MSSATHPQSDPTQIGEELGEALAIAARMQAKAEAEERENPGLVEERKREEKQTALKHAADVLRIAGVPARTIRDLAEGNIRDTGAVRVVRRWASMPLWCLVLGGSYGIGKTVGAAYWLWLIASEAAEAKRTSPVRSPNCWRSAVDLARMGNSDRRELDELALMPALVIDDLGAEYADGKGWFLSILGDLLNKRQQHDRRTLITTNLSGKEFHARYEQRVIERIREGGHFEDVKGPNMRVGELGQMSLLDEARPQRPTARITVRREAYRVRMPGARAVRNRNQLELRFA